MKLVKEHINESINFERSKDPIKAMGIGMHRDIVNRIKQIHKIDNNRDNRFGVITVSAEFSGDDPQRVLNIQCLSKRKYNSKYILNILKELDLWKYIKKTERGGGNFYYYPIKTEYQHLFDKREYVGWLGQVYESVNFERGKDPLDAMNLGNVKERQVRHISKLFQPYVDAIKELQAHLRELPTIKGRIKNIRIADDQFTDIREYYIEFEFKFLGHDVYCSIGLDNPNDTTPNDIIIPDTIITKEEALPLIKQWLKEWSDPEMYKRYE